MAELFGRIISNIRDGSSAAHSYIIEAGSGEERKAFIRDFAAAVMCEELSPDGHACGHCEACRQVMAGTSMDLVHMERSGKNTYLVEDASVFMSRIGMGAYGRRVVGVIDDADLLSETVQNKLLKTLEEPAEGVIVLLASSNADHLLSTVRSRCVKLRAEDCGFYGSEGEEDGSTVDIDNYINVPFYKYREAVDKKVKTVDDALELLGILEELYRDAMLSGRDPAGNAAAIELIEAARMDIHRGMNYGKALKRLRLELDE